MADHEHTLPDTYPGGKGQGSTVRRIINVIPPHDIYIEPFLGRGRVLEAKQPAHVHSYGFELDPRMFAAWMAVDRQGFTVSNADGLGGCVALVDRLTGEGIDPARIVVYFDPPYLFSVRRWQGRVYHREWSDGDHIAFLAMLEQFRCRVIVSHLPCDLYGTALASWHTFTFNNKTRKGVQLEQVWTNYQPTADLHEYTYIGSNFRERERIKRQLAILARRYDALPLAARIAAKGLLDARE